MGQAAKYAILGAAIAVILASVAVVITQFVKPEIFSGFSSTVGSAVSFLNSSIANVKGAINYFLGGGAAVTAFNVMLWLTLCFPIVKLGVKISIIVFRWMNQ